MKIRLASLAILASLSGCATLEAVRDRAENAIAGQESIKYRPNAATREALELSTVTPREDGIYDVQSSWSTQAQALKWALLAAEHTCKIDGLRHVVIDRRDLYRGIVQEDTNRASETAQGVVQGVILATGGGWWPAVSLRRKDDHTVMLKTRCQPLAAGN